MSDLPVLIYSSTASADMRHVITHDVHDPFLYLEKDGRAYTAIKSLESERMQAIPGMTVFPLETLGYDEFREQGAGPTEAELNCVLRACQSLQISRAAVPPTFPVFVADFLRANSVELVVDADLFTLRRRVKSKAELASIVRAQRAAEAGVAYVSDAIAHATIAPDGGLLLDGSPLTCETLKVGVRIAFVEHGCEDAGIIVAHGAQTCIGHHSGAGQIRVSEPVTVDICPRDIDGGGNSDMTRTFVKGDIPEEITHYFDLVKDSYDRSLAAIRPGLPVAELFRISCEPMIAAGQPTQLTKKPGEVLLDGFFHSLGHGVGLEVHEPPSLGRSDEVLIAGDVIAIEPGCYRQGFGGIRLEDIVLVTESGAELLSHYPYDLVPQSTAIVA